MKKILGRIKQKVSDSYYIYKHTGYIRSLLYNSIQYENYENIAMRQTVMKSLPSDSNKILIAFYPTGGFGDYIISSKLLDELLILATPCRIDVYCENLEYGNAIYGNRPGVSILPYTCYHINRSFYDLSLKVEHFVHVLECNAYKIAKISPEFMDLVEALGKSMRIVRPDIEQQCYREAIHFKRCELKKINRWTELRHENIFEINDQWTYINLDDKYKKSLNDINITKEKYITINRGADSMGRSSMQTKVWPESYYVEFIKLFKMKYPDIKVIQLGSLKNTKIKGVDIYILGENLETIKWILKYSLLHLDCEGGLVHLATQLATKCAVLFGPTPFHFYSYPQNINIISEKCCNCMGTHDDWAFSCYRGFKDVECMYAITANTVMNRIKKYIDSIYNNQTKSISKLLTHSTSNLSVGYLEQHIEKYLATISGLKLKKESLLTYLEIIQFAEEIDKKLDIAILNLRTSVLGLCLQDIGHSVTVFDKTYGWLGNIEDTRFEQYMKLCKKHNLDIRFGDIYQIPYQSNSFDLVIFKNSEVNNIEEIHRVLKENGKYYEIAL